MVHPPSQTAPNCVLLAMDVQETAEFINSAALARTYKDLVYNAEIKEFFADFAETEVPHPAIVKRAAARYAAKYSESLASKVTNDGGQSTLGYLQQLDKMRVGCWRDVQETFEAAASKNRSSSDRLRFCRNVSAVVLAGSTICLSVAGLGAALTIAGGTQLVAIGLTAEVAVGVGGVSTFASFAVPVAKNWGEVQMVGAIAIETAKYTGSKLVESGARHALHLLERNATDFETHKLLMNKLISASQTTADYHAQRMVKQMKELGRIIPATKGKQQHFEKRAAARRGAAHEAEEKAIAFGSKMKFAGEAMEFMGGRVLPVVFCAMDVKDSVLDCYNTTTAR